MSTPGTPVLMSADNPGGWKLEELLPQIRAELEAKNERIADDSSQTARVVRVNNKGIIQQLLGAEVYQRDSLRRLDALRSDPGPGGPPRIGAGREA